MKEIYLICQKAIETNKPEYLQNPESIPVFAVDTKEKAFKEIEWMTKDEQRRQKEFKEKYHFGATTMIFEFEIKTIALY